MNNYYQAVPKLDDTNFNQWLSTVKLLLENEGLQQTLLTPISCPRSEIVRATLLILGTITPEIASTVANLNCPAEIVEHLTLTCGSVPLPTVKERELELLRLQQGHDESVFSFGTRAIRAIHQLKGAGCEFSNHRSELTILRGLHRTFDKFVHDRVREPALPAKELLEQLVHFEKGLRLAERQNTEVFAKLKKSHGRAPATVVPKVDISQKGSKQLSLLCSADTKTAWIVDSGATSHMTGSRTKGFKFKSVPDQRIVTASGQTLHCKLAGKGQVHGLRLKDVLLVPGLKCNLISVSKLSAGGLQCVFKGDTCRILHGTKLLGEARMVNGNYLLSTAPKNQQQSALAVSAQLVHKRLGHINDDYLHRMIQGNMAIGLEQVKRPKAGTCLPCKEAKATRKTFKPSGNRAQLPLELVHSDIWTAPCSSITDDRYFVTFRDDYSGMTLVYLMKRKSDVAQCFMRFQRTTEKQLGLQVKALQSDGGKEYCGGPLAAHLDKYGILHRTSISYTPDQNGTAERVNRTLVECANAMRFEANLPPEFWSEAIMHAALVLNRRYSSVCGKTPFEAFYGGKPSIRHLRVFGCAAWGLIPKERRNKLDKRVKSMIYIGHTVGKKGFRLFDPRLRTIVTLRDVEFDEKQFHYTASDAASPILLSDAITNEIQRLLVDQPDQPQNVELSEAVEGNTYSQRIDTPSVEDIGPPSMYVDPRVTLNSAEPVEAKECAKSTALHTSGLRVPLTLNEAMQSADSRKWTQAVNDELASLHAHNTWSIVDRPNHCRPIRTKWVFKLKLKADGSIDKFKARLVAKGFTQREGIDFKETFAPVSKITTIRYLLALAAHHNWDVHQLDVKTAFLNGNVDEELFLELPKPMAQPGKVALLHRSLYGLKQSPRQWYKKLEAALLNVGFEKSLSDESLFILTRDDEKCFITVYVDDLLVVTSNSNLQDEVKASLSALFNIQDFGEARSFLGINIRRDRAAGTISLDQEFYIKQKLDELGLESCREYSTPMSTSDMTWSAAEGEENQLDSVRHTTYQNAVGSLLYLMTQTRPDICYAVGVVSRFMSKPCERHWTLVKRIFGYLKRTAEHKLTYGQSKDPVIAGYSDADWAGNHESRKSTSGYLFRAGNCAISWRSTRQTCVALSSTESELIALTLSAQEALWLRKLQADLQVSAPNAMIIHEDNQGCIALVANPKHHGRTKHIDVRYKFLRDHLDCGRIHVAYLPTTDMIADTMTKPLGLDKFNVFTEQLGLT